MCLILSYFYFKQVTFNPFDDLFSFSCSISKEYHQMYSIIICSLFSHIYSLIATAYSILNVFICVRFFFLKDTTRIICPF